MGQAPGAMAPLAITGVAAAWPGAIAPWSAEPAFPGLADLVPTTLAAALAEPPALGRGGAGGRLLALAEALGRTALAGAGLAEAPPGLGLALGSTFAEVDHVARPKFLPAAPILPTLAKALGLSGPIATLAGPAMLPALAFAARRLAAREAPLMLVGGLDALGPLAVGTAAGLGAALTEGGALVVLEPLAAAMAAGRPVLARVFAVAVGPDAPAQALAEAGLAAADATIAVPADLLAGADALALAGWLAGGDTRAPAASLRDGDAAPTPAPAGPGAAGETCLLVGAQGAAVLARGGG